MTMEAVRDFDVSESFSEWKMGDKHSMFVRFVHHDRRDLAGQSNKIVLDLTEPPAPSEPVVDDENKILPGMTTVEEVTVDDFGSET